MEFETLFKRFPGRFLTDTVLQIKVLKQLCRLMAITEHSVPAFLIRIFGNSDVGDIVMLVTL